MSGFWGYPYADVLAIVITTGLSAVCLLCARLYVKNY